MIERHLSRGLQFTGAYTWSHAIDNTQAGFDTDDSIEIKYFDKPGNRLDKMAFSLTGDAGCEFGGGVDRDVWLPLAVYGQKLNTDASLIFQPINTGIDVHDGTTGLLLYRVALPIELADAYDALAIDNNDGLLLQLRPPEWRR